MNSTSSKGFTFAPNTIGHSFNAETKSVEDQILSIASNPKTLDDVFLMARAFLFIEGMTHKKLQKLCYYAKAWYLALYDENIIHKQFQAWVHGAVQPELYDAYKGYGFDIIPKTESIHGVPETFLSFSREIYDAYGHLSGDELEEINHSEMPWIKARGNCKPWERCTNVISEEDMKTFYRSMING